MDRAPPAVGSSATAATIAIDESVVAHVSDPWRMACAGGTSVKAIIHIGGEKAGSTTIQAFCANNRAELAKQGILYPSSLGASNHLRLTAYSLEDDAVDDIRRSLNINSQEQLEVFRKQLRANLSKEIAATRDISTILLSNEHLQSRLLRVSEVRRLDRLVRNFADEIAIVLYIRRQDRVAVSAYSTRLKADVFRNDTVIPTVTKPGPLPEYYDYNALLTRYEKVFGVENITVRLFDPARFVDGDLVRDFRDACGIPDSAAFAPAERENESLSEIGIKFFKRFNPRVPRFVNGRINPYRHGLNAAMMKQYRGAGPVVARADAEAFYDKFVASNRAVQERYFPNLDGSLFDEDFTHYDREPPPPPSEDDLIDLAVHLWIERTATLEALRIDNALLRFRATVREDPDSPPPKLPQISAAGALPTHLALRYLGALLYIRNFREAADITAALLEGETIGPVVLCVHACALAGLGDQTEFERWMNVRSIAPKLRARLAAIGQAGLATRPASQWLDFFRGDAMSQTQIYARCLGWLDSNAPAPSV
jgi:hypothetical protein